MKRSTLNYLYFWMVIFCISKSLYFFWIQLAVYKWTLQFNIYIVHINFYVKIILWTIFYFSLKSILYRWNRRLSSQYSYIFIIDQGTDLLVVSRKPFEILLRFRQRVYRFFISFWEKTKHWQKVIKYEIHAYNGKKVSKHQSYSKYLDYNKFVRTELAILFFKTKMRNNIRNQFCQQHFCYHKSWKEPLT